jgi:MFS family permease
MHRSSTITALLSFGLVASLAPLMAFAVAVPQITLEWRLSASEAGWIGGIYFAGYAVGVPVLASATDRFDARKLYIGSSLLGAIACFVFAVCAHDFPLALALRFLGGIALAGVHMPGLKLLTDRVEGPAQARSAAIYSSAYAGGSAGSFLISGLVEADFGWRVMFFVDGVGPLLAIPAVALLSSTVPHQTNKFGLAGLRAVLRDRALMMYVLAYAGNTWEVFAVRFWFVAYLSWTLMLPGNALSLPALGIVSGLAALAGLPASIAVAEIASRYGRRRAIIGTCAASVAVCLALAATAGGPAIVVLALLALLQITSFADVGTLSSGAIAAADPARRGTALAVYAFTGSMTGFVSPVVVGVLLDQCGGAQSATGWTAAFVSMALGSAVAAWAVRRLRD